MGSRPSRRLATGRKKQRPQSVTADGRTRSRPPAGKTINDQRWNMPATFTIDGTRMATLRELVDPTVPTKNLVELSRDQLAELTIRRLEAEHDDFGVAIMGIGVVNRARAIAEVKARSVLGMQLIEIEYILIDHLQQNANKQPTRG